MLLYVNIAVNVSAPDSLADCADFYGYAQKNTPQQRLLWGA